MKKITLLLAILFTSLSFSQVTIGSGTLEVENAPFEPYFGYSYAQSIYTVAEIGTSGTITGIQWYYSGTTALPNSQDLTIYMAESSRTEFASTTDWEPIASFTQVYAGGITVSAGTPGWVSITLDTPFVYAGTGNLLIATDENMAGFDTSTDDFHNSDIATNRSIAYFSDSTNPDPAAPPTASNIDNTLPNIILDGLTVATAPNCDAVLTNPLNGATDADPFGGISWSGATGSPTGYYLTVGTTMGGTEVLNAFDVGNVTSYSPTLAYSTTYYVSIEPYNGNGSATGCTEQTFTTVDPPPTGSLCSDPLVIGALPYNTSDDTANYGDDYSGSPGATGCGTTSSYLNGDDVVYSYTATSDTSINVALSAIGSTYSGIFVYADCADIGTACIAGEGNSGTTDRNFDLAVTNGNTYYIVISTWATPQSTTYTLDITENTCTNATVTYTVVDDCAGSGGFFIDVEVTDMGTATALTVSDDQASPTQPLTGIGTVQFGPYTNATDVIITVVDDNDANCTQSSSAITQTACPATNDECSGAIDLDPSMNADGTCTITYTGSNIGATNSAGEVAPSATCTNAGSDPNPADVWFSLTVPATGGFIYDDIVTPGISSIVEVYTGTCGALTALTPVNCTNSSAEKTFDGLTPGTTVYLRYWDYGSDDEGALEFCIREVAACPDPSGMIGNNVTDTSADLTWTENGTATSWNIEWAAGADFTPGTGAEDFATTVMTTPAYNATGLTADTTYYIYYQADCGGETSNWVQFIGATLAPPPANDDCSGAIALTPGAVFSDNPIDGTVEGATDDAEPNACGSNGPGVWYSLVVPASGNITIETAPDAATGDTGFDSLVEAFSGTCGALVSIDCDDDGAATNLFSLLELTGLTAGSTIYLRVWESGGGQWEPYSISAFDASLGLENSQFTGFRYFPNPVEGTLSLRAQNNMQQVAVYNMLGQEVINVSPNAMSNDLDMSTLSRGAYFVRVSIDGAVENFKIIKE